MTENGREGLVDDPRFSGLKDDYIKWPFQARLIEAIKLLVPHSPDAYKAMLEFLESGQSVKKVKMVTNLVSAALSIAQDAAYEKLPPGEAAEQHLEDIATVKAMKEALVKKNGQNGAASINAWESPTP